MGAATLRRGSARVGIAGMLLLVAAGAWLVTVERMAGMDAGPGGDLGAPGWFAVSWLAMTAAMMLPAVAPAALARGRGAASFVAGYLGAWMVAGLLAYAVFDAVRALDLEFLAWDRAGRYVAAGAILAAAAYQLTAFKAGCLQRCRTAAEGGIRAGTRHGAHCVACCAGLMAALFAVGAMSITWMVVVAALIAAERLLPWPVPAVYAVGATLAVLGIWLAVAPADLPGLTLPGSGMAMP
jgi:predicted metal-binding membrane protein